MPDRRRGLFHVLCHASSAEPSSCIRTLLGPTSLCEPQRSFAEPDLSYAAYDALFMPIVRDVDLQIWHGSPG